MQATWHVLPLLIKGLEALLKFLAPAVFHDPSMLLHVQPVLRLNCISQHAILGTLLCHNAGQTTILIFFFSFVLMNLHKL